MRNMNRPAPAPVTIFRPDAAGSLVVSAVVQPTANMRGSTATLDIAKFSSRRFKMDDYIVEELDFDEIVTLN